MGGCTRNPRKPALERAIAETDAVHSDKIGFWGLSQSGWLATEAGAMSDPAFVLSVAAPLTTPGEQMEFLAHNYTLLHGHGAEAARTSMSQSREPWRSSRISGSGKGARSS